jgi:AhpD family alkylhydroperoxidase
MKKKIYRKRIFHCGNFFNSLGNIYTQFGNTKRAFKGKRINHAFAERIMLSVTRVNGCRFCAFGHTKAALAAGISEEEINELLNNEFRTIPENERTALLFAQHFAETNGNYDPELFEKIKEHYGNEAASDIMAYIQLITYGNLAGNTFDAMLYRLRGYTVPQSSIFSEFFITIGVIIFTPLLIILGLLFK